MVKLQEGAVDSTPATGTRAVDRAAALLVAVAEAPEPLAFPELVRASGLPKSTVSRLLTSLERNGLVTRGPSADVRPGPVLAAYARRRGDTDDLVAMARPALERIGQATGETVNLAIRSPRGVAQIDQVDPRYLLGAVNWVDREVPLHATAVGKSLLAFGTPVPAGRLARLTDRTITSRAALADELRLTRDRGWAVADGELEIGLVAVAAPVLDSDGSAVAAISVSGPDIRITPAQVLRIGPMLAAEARELSTLLLGDPAGLTSPGKAGAA